MKHAARELYAQLYDAAVPDWDGEVDFYQELAAQAKAKGQEVLEVACGTGRITLRLAQAGVNITGLDLSPELLAVARGKSAHIPNIQWVQADMRIFDLGKQFGLCIIPGHSFQFMLTPDDQVQCLENIKRHLLPDGVLVVHLDHQDFEWLGELPAKNDGNFTKGSARVHPTTGQRIRSAYLWTFERATQTATVTLRWEALGDDDSVTEQWELDPMALHCVFRFEMEHVLRRVGFGVEAVYGDFFKHALSDETDQMVWVAHHEAF